MWCKRSSVVLNARLRVLSCVLNERKLCVIIIGTDGNVQRISRKALMRQHAEDYSQPLSVSQTRKQRVPIKQIFTRPDIAVQCYLLVKRARPKPKLDTEHMMCFINLFAAMRKCLCGDMTIRSALKASNVCTNKNTSWIQVGFFHVFLNFFQVDTFSHMEVFFWEVCFLLFYFYFFIWEATPPCSLCPYFMSLHL